MNVKNVKSPIAEELDLFEKKFAENVRSKNAMLDRIMRFIIRRKGKQMRPMFVFLAAKICGEITEATYRASSLIELLHTATLVHDDVVDDAGDVRSVVHGQKPPQELGGAHAAAQHRHVRHRSGTLPAGGSVPVVLLPLRP